MEDKKEVKSCENTYSDSNELESSHWFDHWFEDEDDKFDSFIHHFED